MINYVRKDFCLKLKVEDSLFKPSHETTSSSSCAASLSQQNNWKTSSFIFFVFKFFFFMNFSFHSKMGKWKNVFKINKQTIIVRGWKKIAFTSPSIQPLLLHHRNSLRLARSKKIEEEKWKLLHFVWKNIHQDTFFHDNRKTFVAAQHRVRTSYIIKTDAKCNREMSWEKNFWLENFHLS